MDDDALIAAANVHRAEAKAAGEVVFSRRRVIAIADMAGERPMVIVRRMERLGLLKKGSEAWFRANGGITDDHVREARSTKPTPSKQA